MNKNIIIFILLFGLGFSLYINFSTENNIGVLNSTENNIGVLNSTENNTGVLKEKYNYVKFFISKFNSVNTLDDYKSFIKEFNGQDTLYSFLKLGNKKLFLKYMDYYFKNNNIIGKKYMDEMNKIYDNFISKGYYNSEYNNNGEYDYFLISLLNKSIEDKLELCNEGFQNDLDSLNACKKYVLFISFSKNDNDCKLFKNEIEIKWCNDTFELLK